MNSSRPRTDAPRTGIGREPTVEGERPALADRLQEHARPKGRAWASGADDPGRTRLGESRGPHAARGGRSGAAAPRGARKTAETRSNRPSVRAKLRKQSSSRVPGTSGRGPDDDANRDQPATQPTCDYRGRTGSAGRGARSAGETRPSNGLPLVSSSGPQGPADSEESTTGRGGHNRNPADRGECAIGEPRAPAGVWDPQPRERRDRCRCKVLAASGLRRRLTRYGGRMGNGAARPPGPPSGA